MSPPAEVRIIGGLWKRSKLSVADRPGLRPTPDRVRVTLFNWLGHNLDGWRCLDAFAGSGALGFEAASRGASEVTLLERDPQALRQLRSAQARLQATQIRIEAVDAMAWLARCAQSSFELIFLDPPFGAGLSEPALAQAARIAVPGGWVYLETDSPLDHPKLSLHRQGRAGQVHYHLFQR
jgi:16S rRNA (guanine966-N2)-methyltransferase